MKKILNELGLNENDFKIEILNITDPQYNNPLSSLSPVRTITVKINDIIISCSTEINFELLNDLKIVFNVDTDNLLKREIINYYINNNQYVRKAKLQKIKGKYDS